MAFTDPFGLCPPQDTNTADCARDNLGNAWRVLDKSPLGRAVIAGYVRSGFSVEMGSRNGTYRGDKTVTVIRDRLPGAIAVGLAHEEVHANGTAQFGTPEGGGEESDAWEQAISVYESLDGTDKAEAREHYQDEARRHKTEHKQFHREKYCAGANYSDKQKCN